MSGLCLCNRGGIGLKHLSCRKWAWLLSAGCLRPRLREPNKCTNLSWSLRLENRRGVLAGSPLSGDGWNTRLSSLVAGSESSASPAHPSPPQRRTGMT